MALPTVPLWDSSGTHGTEPTAEKTNGWGVAQAPSAQVFNWFMRGVSVLLTALRAVVPAGPYARLDVTGTFTSHTNSGVHLVPYGEHTLRIISNKVTFSAAYTPSVIVIAVVNRNGNTDTIDIVRCVGIGGASGNDAEFTVYLSSNVSAGTGCPIAWWIVPLEAP